MPESVKSTGPALPPVVMTVTGFLVCIARDDGALEEHAAFPNSWTVDFRFYRGLKMTLNVTVPDSESPTYPRKKINLDFHYITGAQLPTTQEPTMILDLCLPPEFQGAKAHGSRGGFKEIDDFSMKSVLSRGRRWKVTFGQQKIQELSAMLSICPRIAILLGKALPAEYKTFENGNEQYAANRKASLKSEFPVVARPLDMAPQLRRIDNTANVDFRFQCYRCKFPFTMEDVLQPAFNHW